jgi:hypothetical protein
MDETTLRYLIFVEKPAGKEILYKSSVTVWLKVNVKVNFTLKEVVKPQTGNRGITLLFLYLGPRWG